MYEDYEVAHQPGRGGEICIGTMFFLEAIFGKIRGDCGDLVLNQFKIHDLLSTIILSTKL